MVIRGGSVLGLMLVLAALIDCGGTPPMVGSLAQGTGTTSAVAFRAYPAEIEAPPAVEGDAAEPAAAKGNVGDRSAEPAKRKRTRRGEVYVPSGFRLDDGAYDLVIHFHGALETVEAAFEASATPAVLFTMNLGNGSGPYEDRFRRAGSFDELLEAVQEAAQVALGQPQARLRRIALSSWSAGYGAVLKILAREADAARVDAVLLEDSMHASLADQRSRRIYDPSIAPFERFARAAIEGQRLMVIAHSSIATAAYASTTEAARSLAASVGLQRAPSCEAYSEPLSPAWCGDLGQLHVRGFEGRDATAHIDQLRHLDETVLARLKARWSTSELATRNGSTGARTDNR